jgi:hypothetical protein
VEHFVLLFWSAWLTAQWVAVVVELYLAIVDEFLVVFVFVRWNECVFRWRVLLFFLIKKGGKKIKRRTPVKLTLRRCAANGKLVSLKHAALLFAQFSPSASSFPA